MAANTFRNRQTVDSRGLVDDATGRLIARVDWLRGGEVRLYTGRGLTPAERERAADWLGDVLLGLTHDERYDLLFG